MAEPTNRRNDTTAAGMAFERPIKEIESQLSELEAIALRTNLDISGEIEALRKRLSEAIDTTYADLTPWERVNVARHSDRPVASDYIEKALDDFVVLPFLKERSSEGDSSPYKVRMNA